MFVNENQFNLGDSSNVKLPNWCNNNPYIYVAANRIAMESEYVSSNLHKWIDLYFTDGCGFCKNDVAENTQQGGSEDLEHMTFVNPTYKQPEKEGLLGLGGSRTYQMYSNNCNLPVILFDKNHVQRGPNACLNNLVTPNISLPFNHRVRHFMKQVLVTDTGIYDFSNFNDFARARRVVLPPEIRLKDIGTLQCIVLNRVRNDLFNNLGNGENFKFGVFLTRNANVINIFDFQTQQTDTIPMLSTVNCVANIGDRYLVVGCRDCSLTVWKLLVKVPERRRGFIQIFTRAPRELNFEARLVSSSYFHSSEILTIGGCYENGLIVSLNTQNILIFETLVNHVFINSVDLRKIKFDEKGIADFSNPQIIVYKSGTVLVRLAKQLLFFNSQGKLIHHMEFNNNNITSLMKWYYFDLRELLFIGLDNSNVVVFDLTTFSVSGQITDQNITNFCPIKNSPFLLCIQNGNVTVIDYRNCLRSEINH